MAPTTQIERDFPDDSGHDLAPTTPARTGILVSIIVGIVLIAAVVVLIAVKLLKRRRAGRPGKEDPAHTSLSKHEYGLQGKQNATERSQEEELERAKLIRKSLMSRASVPSTQGSFSMNLERVSRSESGDDDRSVHGLKDDWKEWEAQLQSDRSLATERHPSLTVPRPTALAPVGALRASSQSVTPPRQTALIQEARSIRIHAVSQQGTDPGRSIGRVQEEAARPDQEEVG
jgi:hypothetical protein